MNVAAAQTSALEAAATGTKAAVRLQKQAQDQHETVANKLLQGVDENPKPREAPHPTGHTVNTVA